MENTSPSGRKVIRISRTKLIIGIIIIVLVFVGAKFARQTLMPVGMGGMSSNMMSVGVNDMPAISPEMDYYRDSDTGISDTREFLKTSYSAQIQTRDVEDVVGDVKNAVRDAEGRIDSVSDGEKHGYISFAVPKSNFDQFRDDIESLTHEKLYTENVSSQNLLNQKQNIEQQEESITTRLAQLEKSKRDADTKHAALVAGFQRDLSSVAYDLIEIRQRIAETDNSTERAQLVAQESVLVKSEANLKYNRDQESRNYTAANTSLVAQINQEKANLAGNEKQDDQFEDNIETVHGSISVNWISSWQMAKLFSPIHPTIIIIILVLILWYYLNRKAYIPKIEIV
ncbi:MAG: DUF4349 domain-containing protein [Candidatus Pacebacteria bacterium]|nr:DUF4349 domain-containing protein [Candidatus Paceibacterota bacterium]